MLVTSCDGTFQKYFSNGILKTLPYFETKWSLMMKCFNSSLVTKIESCKTVVPCIHGWLSLVYITSLHQISCCEHLQHTSVRLKPAFYLRNLTVLHAHWPVGWGCFTWGSPGVGADHCFRLSRYHVSCNCTNLVEWLQGDLIWNMVKQHTYQSAS